jgi:hypothetical protein
MSPRLNQHFFLWFFDHYSTSKTEFAGGRKYFSSFLSASREETGDAYPTQASFYHRGRISLVNLQLAK